MGIQIDKDIIKRSKKGTLIVDPATAGVHVIEMIKGEMNSLSPKKDDRRS